MARIEGKCREVIEKAEWVSVATHGADGPHLAATWGEYIRVLGIRDDEIVLVPTDGYHKTEQNLIEDNTIEMLWASRQVEGTFGPRKGCRIRGTGELQTNGQFAEAAKEKFPWARGVLVVTTEEVIERL